MQKLKENHETYTNKFCVLLSMTDRQIDETMYKLVAHMSCNSKFFSCIGIINNSQQNNIFPIALLNKYKVK